MLDYFISYRIIATNDFLLNIIPNPRELNISNFLDPSTEYRKE
jgi:hypothetical protein